MNNKLTDAGYGHGGRPSPISKFFRSKYANIGMATSPYDWSQPFDIEVKLANLLQKPGFKLPVKDQGQSFSCGGQAGSTDNSIDAAEKTLTFIEHSARYIYSHIWHNGGGTTPQELENFLVNNGDCKETTVVSYQNGAAPTEAFMIDKSWDNPVIDAEAQSSKSSRYVTVGHDIDSVAQGIRDMDGIILALYGGNNMTWRSANPQPPVGMSQDQLWGHFVYAGRVRTVPGTYGVPKKQIGILNSWGVSTGEQGWQWLDENYFSGDYIFDAFGLVWQDQVKPDAVKINYLLGLLANAKQLLLNLLNKFVVLHN